MPSEIVDAIETLTHTNHKHHITFPDKNHIVT